MLAIADVRRNEAWQATHPEETEQLLKQAAAAASPFLKEPGGITGLTRQIEARSHHDTCNRLPQIQVPVLVCGGRYDGQASPDVVENLHRHISGAEIGFFAGGHRFMNEDPEAGKTVAEFLEHQCQTRNSFIN
jgi:3-oxoadipate enol-lactonase